MKRNSWHFKLIQTLDYDTPYVTENLCPYVRAVFKSLFLTVFFILIMIGLLISYFWGLFFPIIESDNIHNMAAFTGAMIPPIIVLSLTGFLARFYFLEAARGTDIGYDNVIYKELFTIKRKKSVDKEPNIFSEYWKAIHDKICPRIHLE